jgi:hypothetical protein
LFLIDYVKDIYQTMVDAFGSKKLEDAIDELKEQTPSPMNTMLNKQSIKGRSYSKKEYKG